MDYKMIVLDLDGTLTNSEKAITPRNKEALLKAQDRGKVVVLASGRPTYGIRPLVEELRLEEYGGYVLSYNGGKITNCRTGEVAFSQMLPVESNARIIGLAKDHGVNILTYEGASILTPDAGCPYAALEAKINRMSLRQVEDMEREVDFPVVKFLMLDDGDYLATVEPLVKAALGKNYSVYRSEPYFLEILSKGIDKAQSLERLLEVLGLRREEMIACGDGYNDLSMIKFAGLGVAMENAVLPVRNAADYITYSNNHDGVAHVVETFLLKGC